MIARAIFFTAVFFTGSCAFDAGGKPALHHPDLSLANLAVTGEADSKVFNSYHPAEPVRWNQGWPWKFDLTGIGWDQKTTVTAITPRHVVMANHYKRKVGRTAVFHDRKGKPHRRVILKVMPTSKVGLRSDVAVGLLDQPLPSSIRNYPLLRASKDEADQLVGAQVLITEQDRRLFFHQIQSIGETTVRFRHDPSLGESKKKRLIPGDSGNPSFILTKGELALIETHSGGGPGSGPFYGSKMIDTLSKVVAQLDSSYQLRTVGIDRKVLMDAEKARESMPQPRANPSPTRKPRPRVVPPSS